MPDTGKRMRVDAAMKPTVFIQANDRQHLGARISAHSYRRNARRPDSFDVTTIATR